MKKGIGTKCVQGGYRPGNGEPRQIPIIQSTTFKYATGEAMGKLFDLEASGYFYSRLQNPTCDTVAAKICEMEGGSAAMLTSSGQAANFLAIFNICSCGDHFVSLASIYGGTFNLYSRAAPAIGSRGKAIGDITINGGLIEAETKGNYSAAIGPGHGSSCGNIFISKNVSSVYAKSKLGTYEAIGKGKETDICGTITIENPNLVSCSIE